MAGQVREASWTFSVIIGMRSISAYFFGGLTIRTVDGIDCPVIRFGGIDGVDGGNQVRFVLIAAFDEMDFVAHPCAFPPVSVAGLQVKRRLDEPGAASLTGLPPTWL